MFNYQTSPFFVLGCCGHFAYNVTQIHLELLRWFSILPFPHLTYFHGDFSIVPFSISTAIPFILKIRTLFIESCVKFNFQQLPSDENFTFSLAQGIEAIEFSERFDDFIGNERRIMEATEKYFN